MSPIVKKYTLLSILCICVLIAVLGCGSPNENSSFDPDGESHPNGWLPARHAAAALLDLDECTQCHGVDFSYKTACTECHMESPTQIHPGEWEDRVAVRHKGYVDDNGTAKCSNIYCHGGTLEGVELSGPSCSSCHLGGPDSIHPKEWESLTYVRHVPYVKDNGNSSCSNSACHGSDLSGVSESGPSCSRCHLGGPDSYHPREWGSNRRMEVGFVKNDVWFLDFNNNKLIDFPSDVQFNFGMTNDIPVLGDWNGDGVTEVGVVRGIRWYLDVNGNGIWDPGTDSTFQFGIAGDIPVTGDWNGDGFTEVGVLRGNLWYLDLNGNGMWNPGVDSTIKFGIPGDIPVTGDWNGDLITDVGTFNDGEWIIDSNGNGNHDDSDETFTLGASGDLPITGDWNRNAYVKLHGVFVGNNGGGSCANAACHGPDFSGVPLSGPGCYICHGPSFPVPQIR